MLPNKSGIFTIGLITLVVELIKNWPKK
ncbi:putative holin-like toxin [Lentilactobacillus buchneri]|nr:putative holin-like toxin [Lentilactobacillus buchneri]MCT3542754.1 putative holin-like toxin [Lentilactobacillus buchneri]MCT3545896.1 putative holin-like toxin [Lentilactobacillus buchneri]MCT3552864.1 putative holin-like toxin [Lentilactobacillus buchneri]TJY03116.1 putative holin-like toxin [Lentilactobacillus buchneri]